MLNRATAVACLFLMTCPGASADPETRVPHPLPPAWISDYDYAAERRGPDPVPNGWVTDYDYSTGLSDYLVAQYELARRQGQAAYAYIYRDASKHCKHIRELAGREPLQGAFDGVRVVMLDIEQLYSDHQERNPDEEFTLGRWAPVILKVSSNGHLTEPVIYPDFYIFHLNAIPERRLRRQSVKNMENKLYLEKQLARRMVEYFDQK